MFNIIKQSVSKDAVVLKSKCPHCYSEYKFTPQDTDNGKYDCPVCKAKLKCVLFTWYAESNTTTESLKA